MTRYSILFAKTIVYLWEDKKIRFAHHILITGVDVVKIPLKSWQEYSIRCHLKQKQ